MNSSPMQRFVVEPKPRQPYKLSVGQGISVGEDMKFVLEELTDTTFTLRFTSTRPVTLRYMSKRTTAVNVLDVRISGHNDEEILRFNEDELILRVKPMTHKDLGRRLVVVPTAAPGVSVLPLGVRGHAKA